MPHFFAQLMNDIDWKRLAVSTLMAVFIAIVLAVISQQLREALLNAMATDPGGQPLPQSEIARLHRIFSSYWYMLPLNIVQIVLTMLLPTRVLVKHTPQRELTNGLALGLACSFFILRFDFLLTLCAISTCLAVAWRVKNKNMLRRWN